MPKRSRSNRLRSGGRASARSGPSKPRDWSRTVDAIIAAGLALMVAAAYVQAIRFDFVNYDDTAYVPDNTHVRGGFSLRGAAWAFTSFETANWYPLTWLSLMLDCQLFGGSRPGGDHAVNAALHCANAILLFSVFRAMTGSRWRSAAVAALFAAHPLHVESVAWIAERKDVLSTFFFMLTLLAYHRYVSKPGLGRWLLVFVGMALGVMAKSMLVTLPAVLLLLDFWPLGRWRGMGIGRWGDGEIGRGGEKSTQYGVQSREYGAGANPFRSPSSIPNPSSLILEKLPLFLLSIAISAVTVLAQSSKGAMAMLDDRATLSIRLANAALAYVTYLVKIFWPAHLAVYYPYDFAPSPWLAAVAALLLVLFTIAAIRQLVQSSRHAPRAVRPAAHAAGSFPAPGAYGGRHPEGACYFAVGWLWYVGTLLPVIGLVQVGSQGMADRYVYIPAIGIYVALAWGAVDLARRLPRLQWRQIALAGAATAILASLLIATWRQAAVWFDSETLFRHAVEVTGENPVACENLGDALLKQGKRLAEAGVDLRDKDLAASRQAEAIKRYAEAEAEFRKVLDLDAKHFLQTPEELAEAIAGQGRMAEAIACVRKISPEDSRKAQALTKLARFLFEHGHAVEASELLQEAARIAPDEPVPLEKLAWIYATNHQFHKEAEAIDLARRACELTHWENAACRRTLAECYQAAGDFERAAEEYRAACKLDPSDADTARKLEAIERRAK
jgi:protein O-mannosyl-transferase